MVAGWSAGASAQTFTDFGGCINNNLITPGPDGALWFGSNCVPGTEAISRITTTGVITNFPLPPSGDANQASAAGLVAGPDGALWYTDVLHSAIGRVTVDGTYTNLFPVTKVPDGTGPTVITAGPDGALWFLDPGRVNTDGSAPDRIGRITIAGVVSLFIVDPLGQTLSSSGFDSITSGSDGALWFTAFGYNSQQIGRITTAGNITFFQPPAAALTPTAGITAGPDGALWFTVAPSENFNNGLTGTGNAIGRITTQGSVTTFPIPTANAGAFGITVGGDGALWFTESNERVNKIGRITTTGDITEYTEPSLFVPTDIATGSDGNLWIDNQNGGTVTRLTLPPPLIGNGTPLDAAVLPSSRSVQVGSTATAFATIINSGMTTVNSCGIAPITPLPANFVYQTTNPATNALTGSANTPVNIAAGQAQSYVIAFTVNAPFAPTDVRMGFSCLNAAPAPIVSGVNTLLLSGSATPVPDIVALAASVDPGILDISGADGSAEFAVATVNVGAAASITAAANTGTATLPLALTICQTVPATGVCMAAPTATVTTTINANDTPTFGIFAQGSGTVSFDPANSRIFVRFEDSGGITRGSTSVAVRTQ